MGLKSQLTNMQNERGSVLVSRNSKTARIQGVIGYVLRNFKNDAIVGSAIVDLPKVGSR